MAVDVDVALGDRMEDNLAGSMDASSGVSPTGLQQASSSASPQSNLAALGSNVQSGTPVLVTVGGHSQALVRVPLTPSGHGDFDEAWLQRVVHEHPMCLPIHEIEPGLDRFTAVCRELKTPHGYVDNLLMTGRGDIALIETKLFRNPQARRDVLAQVLDYAVSLFALTYAEFERAVLASNFQPGAEPRSLYAALPEGDKPDEAQFVDAVQHNLRRGRALLLVVGDGINDRAERLLDGLQAYASFGFTLALVELAVFRMPESDSFLIRPRTLAKTAITQRTIIEVSGTGIVSAREERSVVPETLTSDKYWAALETNVTGARAALEALLKDVEPLGVYPDMLGSLNLKWERSNGSRPLNLGYITKGGIVWLDAASWFVPKELAQRYVTEVAPLFGGVVHYAPNERTFSVYVEGKPLRLRQMLGRLTEWVGPMQRFIDAVAKADAETG